MKIFSINQNCGTSKQSVLDYLEKIFGTLNVPRDGNHGTPRCWYKIPQIE
jgi:hypothetical protein